jgi:predicted RNase H-like nuclease
VLGAESYEEAQALNRTAIGKGLSKQAWFLVPKMREVDELLAERVDLVGRVREAHPEVCFRGLAGSPMLHGKKTREGWEERRDVLEAARPGLGALVETAVAELKGPGVAPDDVMDSAVLALCASRIEEARTLPASPPRDRRGIPMEMVYLSPGGSPLRRQGSCDS